MTGLSQCDRVLRVLADGKPKTVPTIHRLAGTMRLNSRVAELRKRGYDIECERVAGRKGAGAYRYRLISGPPLPPDPFATLAAVTNGDLTPEQYAPRDMENRYRLYVLDHGSNEPRLLATCATPEAVGVAFVTLAREGEFKQSCLGLMDTHGTDEQPGEWLCNPFEAGAW